MDDLRWRVLPTPALSPLSTAPRWIQRHGDLPLWDSLEICMTMQWQRCITMHYMDNIWQYPQETVYRSLSHQCRPKDIWHGSQKTSHLQWTYHFFDHMDGSKRWYADEHQHSCSYQILVNKCSMMFIPPRYGIIMHYIIGNYSVYFRIW